MRKNKKKSTILYLVLSIFLCFTFSTIAYSAISSTMNISGDAYARVDADIRITSFKLSTSASNGVSSYEEYSKNTISSNIQLLDDANSVTYDVEVTNYGNVDMGIYDITGLPSGLSYELINYNKKDKLCDDTGKCNGMAKKTFQIKITGSSGTYDFVLNFDFRQYHNVTYTNIDGSSYPKYVIDGGDLNVTFTENLKRVSILSNGTEVAYYDSITSGQTITLNNITNDIEITKNPAPAKLISGSITEPGSLVCISDECFHVLSNDGSTVTLLARYNLLVGYYGSDSEISGLSYANKKITPTPLNYLNKDYKLMQMAAPVDPYNSYELANPTGIQDPTAKAWVTTGFPYIGTTGYSDYETYYPTYETYLENLGITINNIRNITLEEIQNLGCGTGTSACPTSVSWIYSTTYWTSTAESHENYMVFTDNNVTLRYTGYTSYVGLRPVIEISINDIDIPTAKVISGDVDTAGAEVCIGNECFYTISSTTDTVTMLSKYNLYVGYQYDDVNGAVKLTDETGIQNSIALGYIGSYSAETPCVGVIPFSNGTYHGTNYSDYSGSLAEHYVNNYISYLKGLGTTTLNGRLILLDELKKLGCSVEDKTCSSAPKWVYSTSYWTGSAASTTNVYRVISHSGFDSHGYSFNKPFGVRPVITIPKSELMPTINITIDNVVYYAEEGMTWQQWINSKYNTLGLSSDGTQVIKEGLKKLAYTSTATAVNIDSEVDPNITYMIYDFNNYIEQ